MRKNFIVAVGGIILLIILNVFLLFQMKSEKINTQIMFEKYNAQQNKEESKSYLLLRNLFYQYESEAFPVVNFSLKDIETRDSFLVSSLMENKAILLFRFRETHCDLCVNKFMDLLKEIPDDFPSQNLVVLCGYGNVHEYRTFVRKNNLRMPIFNIQEIPDLPIERKDNPYFFVLDAEMKIKNIFIPNENEPDGMNKYLTFIKNKYWNDIESDK